MKYTLLLTLCIAWQVLAVPPAPNTTPYSSAITIVGANIAPENAKQAIIDLIEQTSTSPEDVLDIINEMYADRVFILEGKTNNWNSAFTHTTFTNNPHNVTAGQIDVYTKDETDNRIIAATNSIVAVESDPVTTPRVVLLEGRTNNWNTAYTHSQTDHAVTPSGGFMAGTEAVAGDEGAVAIGGEAWDGTTTAGTGAVAVGAGASADMYAVAVGPSAVAADGAAVGRTAMTVRRGDYIGGGGAVGAGAQTDDGGAVGYFAWADAGGGAVGNNARSTGGGAVGNSAVTTDGGAVGTGAMSGDGFAGGKNATTLDTYGQPIDAVQFGDGNNPTPRTGKLYDEYIATKPYVQNAISSNYVEKATQGWLLYDAGSNVWLRVMVSNLCFSVYEVIDE